MQIIRTTLLKPDLFCQQISLNLAIVDRYEGNFKEKNHVSVMYLCGH